MMANQVADSAHWAWKLQCGELDSATSPRFQSMWPLPSVHVCKLLCPWAPLKGPLHIIPFLSVLKVTLQFALAQGWRREIMVARDSREKRTLLMGRPRSGRSPGEKFVFLLLMFFGMSRGR